ncbi:hypothetical protein C8R48DRAFT_773648 [Suillus tomentosus]|nr:hypothetical protein C8R48DRAFT_773648 [Suillus tomentosus]
MFPSGLSISKGHIDLLSFDRLFFTVAIKEGTNKIIHIDYDNINSITLLIAFGDWEGGYIILL